MGFRDIHAFNLAMLAKQAGDRHTIHIHCFVGFIRYFPSCSFMEAELGYKSSYVWRSLLAARDVIIEGTRWRVGNGTKIEVSSSRQLSHRLVFLGEERPSTKVSEFIDTNTQQWNRLKICETFAPRTRKEILAIPLNRSRSRDILI